MPAESNASPALAADRLFVTAERTHLLAVDRAHGNLLWDREVTYVDTLPEAQRPEARRVAAQVAETARELEDARTKINEARRLARRRAATDEDRAAIAALKERIAALETKVASGARYLPPDTQPTIGNSSPTPVTDGQFVWALFGSGVVACFRLDGALRWAKQLEVAPQDAWMRGYERGTAASPILVGRRLIVARGQLIALDADRGDELWRGVPYHSFGTSALARIGTTDVLFTPEGQAVRVSDGRTLAIDLSMLLFVGPVVGDGLVIYAGTDEDKTGYHARARAFRLPATVGDSLTLKPIWEQPLKATRIYATPILQRGHLLTVDNDGRLTIQVAATGALVEERMLGHLTRNMMPSPAVAGDRIFIASEAGETVTLSASPPFVEIARGELSEIRSSPVFSGPFAWVRTTDKLYCLRR